MAGDGGESETAGESFANVSFQGNLCDAGSGSDELVVWRFLHSTMLAIRIDARKMIPSEIDTKATAVTYTPWLTRL
jgi:hypothetical protein